MGGTWPRGTTEGGLLLYVPLHLSRTGKVARRWKKKKLFYPTSTSIKRYKTNDLLSYENNLLIRIVINSSCKRDSTALNRGVRRLAKILWSRCKNLKKTRSRCSTIDSSQVAATIFHSSEKLTSGKNASFWNIQQVAGSRSRPIRRRLFCDEFLPYPGQ